MQQASEKIPSGMVTIKGLNENEIQELCTIASNTVQSQDTAVIANYLYPRGHVIAGPMDAVEYVLQFGKSKVRLVTHNWVLQNIGHLVYEDCSQAAKFMLNL